MRNHEKVKVAVIGLGYVGLPLALHLVEENAEVLGIDINTSHVEKLKRSESTIADVSNDRLASAYSTGRLQISNESRKIRDCKFIIVCVPTPLNSKGEIDLTALEEVAETVSINSASGALIVNESTSYPGTLREVFQSQFEKNRFGDLFYFAAAPERVNPGSKFEFRDVPRVVGGVDIESTSRAVKFYSLFFTHVYPVSSPEVAEISKLLENSFRYVNISLINEFNELCRRAGIETHEVIDAAATKPYGFMKFTPSAGIGGHCIPVDPEYLQFYARRVSSPLRMVSTATEVNNEMGERVIRRIERILSGKTFSRVLLLGVSYKSNIPDVRDTPAKAIIDSLLSRGIMYDWHDPLVAEWRNEKSCSLKDGEWDIGIIITAHDVMDINLAQDRCKMIFDCTGKYAKTAKVIEI